MSPLVVLILLSHITYTLCSNPVTYVSNRHLRAIPPQKIQEEHAEANESQKKDNPVVVNVSSKANGESKPSESKEPPPAPVDNKKNATSPPVVKNVTKVDEHKPFKSTEMESGALLRGVSVVVALTTLVIIYMALKTYCGKRNKNPLMVSKYGVRTRRSDIEMTPLPLEEDDDDETLFEVNSTNR